MSRRDEPRGTLFVVGTGIKSGGHFTADASFWLRHADKVLYVVADAVTERAIRGLSPHAESLSGLYGEDKRRLVTYEAMVERILGALSTPAERAGRGPTVCAVFYGHPGVYVLPSHEAVRRARALGHDATMLPGISAEDCLFADLGVDPAASGWQSFEATDFLVRARQFDPCAGMALWQIGAIGNLGLARANLAQAGLELLREVLIETYGAEHEVVVYEAASLPTCDPLMHRTPLRELLAAPVTPLSTLYVPPRGPARLHAARLQRLGLSPVDFGGRA